jgi:hypothetical protein
MESCRYDLSTPERDRRKQMFRSRKQDALLHQAGGVADAGDVPAAGFDRKVVKIGAAKDDAGVGGSGNKAKVAKNAGMEANSFRRDFTLNGVLEHGDSDRIALYAPEPISILFIVFNNLHDFVQRLRGLLW